MYKYFYSTPKKNDIFTKKNPPYLNVNYLQFKKDEVRRVDLYY